jgi:antitoxin component of RelBE/YafQ-DinJ toxin-antitoxin module
VSFIQVRNVTDDLREAAKQRAAALGLDLSTYVRRLIERDLAQPTMSAWLDNVLSRPLSQGFDPAQAVREAREQRDARIAGTFGG